MYEQLSHGMCTDHADQDDASQRRVDAPILLRIARAFAAERPAKPPPTITTVGTDESLMPARVAIPEPAVYAPPSDAKQRHQQ